VCISHIIQLTPQELSAEPQNSASAEALNSGQKTKRGIEGEDPAAVGIRRFFSFFTIGSTDGSSQVLERGQLDQSEGQVGC